MLVKRFDRILEPPELQTCLIRPRLAEKSETYATSSNEFPCTPAYIQSTERLAGRSSI
jgi:hypothetical protein